jgi:hypothetical protein
MHIVYLSNYINPYYRNSMYLAAYKKTSSKDLEELHINIIHGIESTDKILGIHRFFGFYSW